MKHSLIRGWPIKWPRARQASDLRFIFLGKEVQDSDKLQELKNRTKSSDVVTIHLVIRERNPGSPTTPQMPSPAKIHRTPIRQPNFDQEDNKEKETEPPSEEEQVQEPHFHAVTVSEKELNEFRMIFDRKKGADGLIAMGTVRAVLQSYWKFIHREGFEVDQGQPFPENRLEELRRKVEASEDKGLTLDQFLSIFYLFDNLASEEKCIHGDKERVRIATSQLHLMILVIH